MNTATHDARATEDAAEEKRLLESALPCPFCGDADHEFKDDASSFHYLICTLCGCCSPYASTKSHAVTIHNTRVKQ